MNAYNLSIFTFAVLSLLLYLYYKRTRLPILTTKIFTYYLWVTIISVVLEIAYTTCALKSDTIPSGVSVFIEHLVLYTSQLVTFFYFMYLFVQLYSLTKATLKKYLHTFVPITVGTFLIFLSFCSFLLVGQSGYNDRYIIYVSSFICFLYMLAVIILCIRFKEVLRHELFLAEIIGVLFWTVLNIIQTLNIGWRTAPAPVLAMTTLVFIASENPRDFAIRNYDNLMNRYAFERMLSEHYRRNKRFVIFVFTLTDKKYLLFEEDRKKLKNILNNIATKIKNIDLKRVFLTSDKSICMFMEDIDDAKRFIDYIDQNQHDLIKSGKYRIQLIKAPSFASNKETALQIVDYLSEEYASKQAEKVISVDNRLINKMLYEKTVEDILRRAIKNHSFEVYYQPIYGIKERAYVSAEALVRLKESTSMGFISPEVFIPIAEKLDIIKEIDDQVFQKVCKFYKEQDLDSLGIHHIEINLSGKEVMDANTPDRLVKHISDYDIEPGHINLEITETAYIDNEDIVVTNMNDLKNIGCSFSMDDFGSGYSNLKGMLQMQFNMIKLDKEFVWMCLDENDNRNLKMLDLCVNFMQEYGMHVLAEGVETETQQDLLASHGVEYIQGYYHSKPLPEDEFIKFVNSENNSKNTFAFEVI